MPRTRIVSRIPVVSRLVVMMAGALLAVTALMGLPDGSSAPAYSTAAYSTVAYSTVSDTSPATPLSTAKCKKKCKKRYQVSDSDLKNLSDNDVAALGTVLAVIALAAVI